MRIAFIGCDGSGKTTLAKKIIERLGKKGFNCEYRHQYNYFLSNTLGNKIRKREKITRNTDRKKFYYKLWIFVVYPNLLFQWLWTKIMKKNKFFISDRYVYDSMVGWELQGRLTFLSRFILENFPKPDRIFLIDAKPKTLYKRRGDEYPDMDFCKKKRNSYINFARKKKIKIINTEKSIGTCVKEIIKSIGYD